MHLTKSTLLLALLSPLHLAAAPAKTVATSTSVSAVTWADDYTSKIDIWVFYQPKGGSNIYYDTYNGTTGAFTKSTLVPNIKPGAGSGVSANTFPNEVDGQRQVAIYYSDTTGAIYEEVFDFATGVWRSSPTQFSGPS